MFPLDKCCYVLPLKTGMIIIGIIDIVTLLVLGGFAVSDGQPHNIAIGITLPLIHIIGCILLLISVCVPKKLLPIGYLVTSIFRLLIVISYIVLSIIDKMFFTYPLISILLCFLYIYFWICVYSWYIELKNASN